MLIGLLISVFVIIFAGGDESEFVSAIPKLKKEIRQNVDDQVRQDSVMVLLKLYEKDLKKYEKGKGKMQKKLQKTSKDRTKGSPEFMAAYDAYYSSTMDVLSTLIDYRILFQEQITDEELQQITKKAQETSKKGERQQEKGEKKMTQYLEDTFDKLEKVVVKHVADPGELELLMENLEGLKRTIFAFTDEALEINRKRLEMLDKRSTTREDLLKLYQQSSSLRLEAATDYARFREEAIKHTTEREWKAISRELKAFT